MKPFNMLIFMGVLIVIVIAAGAVDGMLGYNEWRQFPRADVEKIQSLHSSGAIGDCGIRAATAARPPLKDFQACFKQASLVEEKLFRDKNPNLDIAILVYECQNSGYSMRVGYQVYRGDGILHCSLMFPENSGNFPVFDLQSMAPIPRDPNFFLRTFILLFGT